LNWIIAKALLESGAFVLGLSLLALSLNACCMNNVLNKRPWSAGALACVFLVSQKQLGGCVPTFMMAAKYQ
jgi:hypothetical protein